MTRPDAPPQARPRWWLVALVVGWVGVLAGGIVWATTRGEPTAREQTTVAQALPVVDRASAQIATAAAADGLAVVAISGFDLVEPCGVTVFRDGARYQRVVTAVVAPGTERALMERVAARLPAGYEAAVRASSPVLIGDAGFFVRLRGSVAGPGLVRFVADTGTCRPEGDLAGAGGTEPGRAASPVADVFTRLGVAAQRWTSHRLDCPGGGTLSTVEGVGTENALPDAVDAALGQVEGEVASTPDLYGYRDDGVHVIVRVDGSHLVVTASTPCR